MKITFEGQTIEELFKEMSRVLATVTAVVEKATKEKSIDLGELFNANRQGPGPAAKVFEDKPVEISGEISGEKPKKARTPKQLENDERLRAAAQAKKAAGQPPMVAKKAAPVPQETDPGVQMPVPPPPATAESLGLAPDEVAKNRAKTVEDLQAAYANGFQDEVLELLSRFGNGAKSFRELPPEAFVPIREAIDNGALT